MRKLMVILLVLSMCIPVRIFSASNISAKILSSVILEDGSQFASVSVAVSQGTSDVTLLVIGDSDNGESQKFSFAHAGKMVEGYIYYMEQAQVTGEKMFSIPIEMPKTMVDLENCIYVISGSNAVKASKVIENEMKSLTVRIGQNGKIRTAGDDIADGTVLSLPAGSIVSFEIIPDRGYVTDGVSLNGSLTVNISSQYTTPPIQSDTVVAFSFRAKNDGRPLDYPAVQKGERIALYRQMERYTPAGYRLIEYGLVYSPDDSQPELQKKNCFSILTDINPVFKTELRLPQIPAVKDMKRKNYSRPYAVYYVLEKQQVKIVYGQ